jgi:hypothetical protein
MPHWLVLLFYFVLGQFDEEGLSTTVPIYLRDHNPYEKGSLTVRGLL